MSGTMQPHGRHSILPRISDRSATILAVIAATVFTATDAQGQRTERSAVVSTTAALRPGDRVRVWTRDARVPRLSGDVVSLDSATLHLNGTTKSHVPFALVDSLDVNRGTGSKWKQGALVGAFGLGMVGLLAGSSGSNELFDRGASIGIGLGGGVIFGGLIGGLVGRGIGIDRWEPVSLEARPLRAR